jgi:hypothetical protein
MPTRLTLTALAVLVSPLLTTGVHAQRQVDISGYHVSAGLNSTLMRWDGGSGIDYGVGANIDVGINFNSRIGFFLGGTGAKVSANVNGLTQGHADLGLRFSMPGPGSPLVPYAEVALTYLTAEHDSQDEQVEYSGRGGTGAVGFNYFVTEVLAFDANFRLTKGNFTSVRVDGEKVSFDEGLTTSRINIGLAWFPKGAFKASTSR